MHVEYLQYLVEVSNSKSISAAAKKLYLSQTSLSAIIASLENDLNIKFFKRTHRGITVTPEGNQALEIIKEILEKNEELHSLAGASAIQQRFVNVAVYPSMAPALSTYLNQRFAAEHPDISLQILELPYSRTFNAISEGLTHIAVAAENSALIDIHHEMVRHGIDIEPLYEDRFYLIVSERSPYADRESVDIEEITGERLAFTHAFPSYKDRHIAPVIRRFHTFAIFNDISTVKWAVAKNSAIALVPGIALLGDELVASGRIRQIPVTGFETQMTNYLLYERYSILTVTERAALIAIKEFYSSLSESKPD